MDIEAIVSLLEDRLEDIKNNLGSSIKDTFFRKLVELSESLIPKREVLENWADKVAALLNKYEYTRGLLEGVVTALRCSISRGRPEGEITSLRCEPTAGASRLSTMGKTYEEKLLHRIKQVINTVKGLQ